MAVKRRKLFMLAQYLNSDYYDWDSGKYSDKIIISNANKYGSKDYQDRKNKYHYLYVIYHSYYFPLMMKFQHPFNDYKYIFNSKVPLKVRAKLIQLHIVIRLNYFYFTDTLNNEKHSRGKKGQTNIVPPVIATKLHNRDKKDGLSRNKTIIKVSVLPHLHFVIQFNKKKTPNQLSHWCGVQPQYFEAGKGGRYGLENAMAYLIHAKQPEKHLYDFRDVWSNKPIFDYQKYFVQHAKKWKAYRAKGITTEHSVTIDWLAQRVQHGDLTKQDILRNPQFRYVYADNMDRINNAIQFHSEFMAQKTLDDLRHHRFSLSVFYVWGQSGSGKTRMALKLADDISKKYHWQVYQGASTNSFDDYSGEPIVVMDDVRSSTMVPTDWLKLLDPINNSPISARFHNKTVSARVIIMTNPEPPAKFFGYMKNVHGNEPLSQFIRRITEIAHIINVQGHREILISGVRKLPKATQIKIGEHYSASSDNDEAITRGTRYVSYPNQNASTQYAETHYKKFMDSESQAIQDILNDIEKNNDVTKKHFQQDKKAISMQKWIGSSVDDIQHQKKEEAKKIRKRETEINNKNLPF